MAKISRDEIKKKGLGRLLRSFKFSMQGLAYSYKNEQSMWIHAIATVLTVILGLVFNLKITEWALIFIALGITLACELINTSIEAVVDMVTLEIHPLAKIAKDCGSAATFVLTLVSFVIILLVFVPYFI